ncbi:MAG: NUDIX domain-containing protein [Candidatus Micrarchaeota archaeon]|nr:NUDIX domain-containing protein [Candidatus Micrarchaeota archaeon]
MDDSDVLKKLAELSKRYAHFPDGRVNYTGTDYAPAVQVFIRVNGEILLLKRSDKVANYKGKWNSIGGFIDAPMPIQEKAIGEAEEELGITRSMIKQVITGDPYELYDPAIKKTWLICPFILELNSKPEIRLDFENSEYRWIKPGNITKFDRVFGLERSYAACTKGKE